ncbi:hypothetical protein E2I00_019526, partial [Balaenoptera physalus]
GALTKARSRGDPDLGPQCPRTVRSGAQTPSGGRIVQSTGRGRGAPRVLTEELGRARPPGSTSPRPQRRSPLAGGAGGQAPIRPELPGQQMGIQPQACFPSPPCLNLPLGPLVVPPASPAPQPPPAATAMKFCPSDSYTMGLWAAVSTGAALQGPESAGNNAMLCGFPPNHCVEREKGPQPCLAGMELDPGASNAERAPAHQPSLALRLELHESPCERELPEGRGSPHGGPSAKPGQMATGVWAQPLLLCLSGPGTLRLAQEMPPQGRLTPAVPEASSSEPCGFRQPCGEPAQCPTVGGVGSGSDRSPLRAMLGPRLLLFLSCGGALLSAATTPHEAHTGAHWEPAQPGAPLSRATCVRGARASLGSEPVPGARQADLQVLRTRRRHGQPGRSSPSPEPHARDPLRRGPSGNISRVIVELGASVVTVEKAVVSVKDVGAVSLPYSSNGLQITPFGQSVRLVAKQLELELVVMWGPGTHLMVLVEKKHMGKMCGLCGNFDGEKTNEFLSEDGRVGPAHGIWQGPEANDTPRLPSHMRGVGCGLDPYDPECPCAQAQTCIRLLTLVSPECNVPKEPFLLSCQVDMATCAQPGRHNCSCATLSEYSRQCSMAGQPGRVGGQALGAQPLSRGPHGPAAVGQCPANQVYRECGETCVRTCSNPQHSCSSFCTFGCFCPEGEDSCSPRTLGKEPRDRASAPPTPMLGTPGPSAGTWPGEGSACTVLTAAPGHGRMCPSTGSKDTASARGPATGGHREHAGPPVLSRPSSQSPQLPDGGSLMAVYDQSGYSRSETSLAAVIYMSSQDKIVISQDEVITNNRDTKWLPYKTRTSSAPTRYPGPHEPGPKAGRLLRPPIPSGNITVFRQTSTHIQMVTTFGLELVIQLWPVFQVYITVGPQFRGQTRGESLPQLPRRCVYQACNYEETFPHICAALGDYALACTSRGVLLQGWRSSACDRTCLSLSDREAECHPSAVPVDGCNCPEGTYLNHKTECVRKAQCPCLLDGSNRSSEDKFGAACAPTCQMLATGTPCVPTKCEPGCVCAKGLYENANGQCVPPEECPCEFAGVSYPKGAELHTDCKSWGTWTCQQSAHCPSTCTLYGEGHVVTFDGQRFVFDGNCEYILATDSCGASDSQPTFKILTENVVCGKSGVTCSRAIKIFLGGLSIVLADRNYTVSGEDPSMHFRVKASSLHLVLDATISSTYHLTLIWNKHMTVFIKIARASQDALCGLCGNYNGNMKDDFQTRSKYLASSELEFVYRLPYYEACVRDACGCDAGGDCECLCDAVAAYAQACLDKGVCVDWRSPDFCPIYCDFYNTHTQVGGGKYQYAQEANCTWHYQPCLCPEWPQSVPGANIEGTGRREGDGRRGRPGGIGSAGGQDVEACLTPAATGHTRVLPACWGKRRAPPKGSARAAPYPTTTACVPHSGLPGTETRPTTATASTTVTPSTTGLSSPRPSPSSPATPEAPTRTPSLPATATAPTTRTQPTFSSGGKAPGPGPRGGESTGPRGGQGSKRPLTQVQAPTLGQGHKPPSPLTAGEKRGPFPRPVAGEPSIHGNTLPDHYHLPYHITPRDPPHPCVNICHFFGDSNLSPSHHPNKTTTGTVTPRTSPLTKTTTGTTRAQNSVSTATTSTAPVSHSTSNALHVTTSPPFTTNSLKSTSRGTGTPVTHTTTATHTGPHTPFTTHSIPTRSVPTTSHTTAPSTGTPLQTTTTYPITSHPETLPIHVSTSATSSAPTSHRVITPTESHATSSTPKPTGMPPTSTHLYIIFSNSSKPKPKSFHHFCFCIESSTLPLVFIQHLHSLLPAHDFLSSFSRVLTHHSSFYIIFPITFSGFHFTEHPNPTIMPVRSSFSPPSSPTLSPLPTSSTTVLPTSRTTASNPTSSALSSRSTTSQPTSLTTRAPTQGLLSSTLGVTAIPNSPATNLTTRQPSTTGLPATVFLTSSITAHGSSSLPTAGSSSTRGQSISSLITSLPSSPGTCSVREFEEEVTYQGCTANVTVTRCEGVCASSA